MKPASTRAAIVAIMAAEQNYLCALERALEMLVEGSAMHAAIDDLYGRAVAASENTQQKIFSAGDDVSPMDLVRALAGEREPSQND